MIPDFMILCFMPQQSEAKRYETKQKREASQLRNSENGVENIEMGVTS